MPPLKDTNINDVDISIASEEYLLRLFGKPMLYIHGIRSSKRWKGILQKLSKAINKSIKLNVNSDGLHKNQIYKYLGQLETACKATKINQPDVILPLTGIIFELMGQTPNYRNRVRINRKTDYSLQDLRTLQYTQSDSQKTQTILESSHYKPFCDTHKHIDLFDIYVSNFNGKPSEFIVWYKQKYPEIYLQLF